MIPWAYPSLQPKRHLDRFSRLCKTHRRVSVYFTMGRPFLKIVPSHGGDMDPPSIHVSLGPPESSTQQTDGLTDHATRYCDAA